MRSAILAGSLLCSVLALASCAAAAPRVETGELPARPLKDGEFIGTAKGWPLVATVLVTIKDGRIAAIRVLRVFHHPEHGAEALLKKVIEGQSLAVEVVAGATVSSKVLLEAIGKALGQSATP